MLRVASELLLLSSAAAISYHSGECFPKWPQIIVSASWCVCAAFRLKPITGFQGLSLEPFLAKQTAKAKGKEKSDSQ